MRSLVTVIKQLLVIACVLQFLVEDTECKKRHHDSGCQQSCYDDEEWSSCNSCQGHGGERSSKKEFKMPKFKMPKFKKSKKSKKHNDDDDEECGYNMCPQYCPRPCPQFYPQPQPFCAPARYLQQPWCPCPPQRMDCNPCFRPPILPHPQPPPCPRLPCPQACPPPCPPPQPCSHPTPNCQPPCFESTLKSSCDPQASVQKIIVEKGPAIIQNIIFDKEFCEKYFETYGCYPAIDGLPFQLPTQHVTLGNNCDEDCSTCVNTLPCPQNNICGPPPCQNVCGRNPIPLPSPISFNKYYPSPCPC
ncbi:keratin-associated protein 16-1 [Nilaparvata lugens]|uniref:keratin-associated protein 16-1 n=1 Tax=Nilaparvata lugens TaxID=108931 RepID=UPI00193DDD36|nr:keratin-associated protein 16-1 [Nilaparvata lugens]